MTIHLVGDSIRLNAEPTVRGMLAEFVVKSPVENCESSTQVRKRIAEWLPAVPGDLVHINCGLHDLRYDAGASQPVNTLAKYVDNLRAIFDVLAATGATVVWATSTPFDEGRHNAAKASRRYRADLQRYNAASVDLARAHGFAVHDLHAVVLSHDLPSLLLDDGLHFNAAGNAVVGAAIARVIRKHLSESEAERGGTLSPA
ncbi:SGNH/GDSL hydrolase family protein [Luteimonas aestuarii]|uniref:SGNH/GDSL hydrolase family protein n=1 Tax=Luteimonas aestuarii TaxID=453837 RepID=A0A4R5TMI7_9GAMM|nr:SGNH/GDSL hydrolase family protein [Luteimonas aestuarii]TDK23873.1 SGNH/GDSL hydrolase family protein [Luteimonas aestuarii]